MPEGTIKHYRLTSTPMWHAPGMVRNYRYAVKVGDIDFIRIFEAAYPLFPTEAFQQLVRGNYTLSPDGEDVLLVVESSLTSRVHS